jgi:M6 family metalloprotease-like protein
VTTGEVDALLNQPGYALDGNRGSVRDFWLTMSNGKLDYANDVVGPVTLSRPMSSYFVPEGTPSPAAPLIGEALDLALAGGVDLHAYDSRNEGVVDALSFMYAGLTIYRCRSGRTTACSSARSPAASAPTSTPSPAWAGAASTCRSGRSATSPATCCAASRTCTTTASATATSRRAQGSAATA